ncbi:MAG: lycopene cyclase domain-containing protein [Methanoregula sp.]|jgi:hypothetical protein|nr:lycopene cyclase domain-containing protein [Methanoregula sp.]
MHLTWLVWSLILIGIWIVVWFLIKSRDLRKQMLIISLWTSLLGLTEPIFVPAYWLPPSLFDLAARTGFDIESLIFSFSIGGLGFILYMLVFPIEKEVPVPMDDRLAARHKYHAVMLSVAPVVFVILYFGTKLNPIYVSVIALMLGGIATWYCRPDLKKKMFVSAFLFLGLYFVYFLTLITMFPGYVQQVWNLPAISGILIVGIPIEELMFALSFGFFWSTAYEHFTWKRLPGMNTGRIPDNTRRT